MEPEYAVVRSKPVVIASKYLDTNVFFLARCSNEDEATIKKELKTPYNLLTGDDKEKKFNYVPWTGPQDLESADLETWIPRYMSYLDETSDGAIDRALFIDRPPPADDRAIENPLFIDKRYAAQSRVIFAQCKWQCKVLPGDKTIKLDTMDIFWGSVSARRTQTCCIEAGSSNDSWTDIRLNIPKARRSKAERKQMAGLGKSFTEAGLDGFE